MSGFGATVMNPGFGSSPTSGFGASFGNQLANGNRPSFGSASHQPSFGIAAPPSQPTFNPAVNGQAAPSFGFLSGSQPMGTAHNGSFGQPGKSNTPSTGFNPTTFSTQSTTSGFNSLQSNAPTNNLSAPNPFAAAARPGTDAASTPNPFMVNKPLPNGTTSNPFAVPASANNKPSATTFPSSGQPSALQAPAAKPAFTQGTIAGGTVPSSNDSEKRDRRFNESTDIGELYNKAVAERVKLRQRLIDEGVIDDPDKRKTLDQAIQFIPTCHDMCPEFECLQRRHQKFVDALERTNGVADHSKMVKSFHRPAAGMEAALPGDVRTPDTLVRTMRYLIHEVMNKFSWPECHGFVRDRTRGIRQDFTLQNYESGDESVICHEINVRFHILSLHVMSDQPDHAEYMELEQLDKCFTTLSHAYNDGQRPDEHGNKRMYPNEPEFRAYTILRHVRDHHLTRYGFRGWTPEVIHSPEVQHALRIHSVLSIYDRKTDHGLNGQQYVKTFFDLFKSKETTFTMACLLQTYFPEIRKYALKMMAENYMKTSKMTTLAYIKEFLCYETMEQLEQEIQHYGFGINENEVEGIRYKYLIPAKDAYNYEASKLRTVKHESLLNPKLYGRSLTDIMWGDERNVIQKISAPPTYEERAWVGNIPKCVVDNRAVQEFFNFPEAGKGESFDIFQTKPIQGVQSGAAFAAVPASQFGQPSGFAFGQPPQQPRVFSTAPISNSNGFSTGQISTNNVNGFSAPVAPKQAFGSAPAFAAQSIPNPFGVPQSTGQTSAPFASQPASTGNLFGSGTPNGVFGKPQSPFNIAKASTQVAEPKPSPDDKPLFLGGEEDVSDTEAQHDNGPASTTTPSWTSFFPAKPQSTSLQPEPGPPSTTPTGSIFDKRPAAPTTFQFKPPQATPVTDGASLLFAPKQSSPSFTPTSSISFTPKGSFDAPPTPAAPLFQAAPPAPVAPVVTAEMRNKELLSFTSEAVRVIADDNDEVGGILEEFLMETHERDQVIEEKLNSFKNRHDRLLLENVFYFYVKKARRHKRRTDQLLRQQQRQAYAEDPQWWPILKDGDMFKDSVEKVSADVFKSADLQGSLPEIVHMAFAESDITNATYRMLLHNNDFEGGRSTYWFQQKFLGAADEISVMDTVRKNAFYAQLSITAEEASEVGFVLFGCKSDFSISNEERFAADKQNLHYIMQHLTKNSKYARLALMVVCYRSPIDDEPANPNGDGSRTLGKARKIRIDMVKKALGFDFFDDKVVGRKVVMVETLRDLDLTHGLRTFADEYVLETINPHYSEDEPTDVEPSVPTPRAKPPATSPGVQKRKLQQTPTRPKSEPKRKRIVASSPQTPLRTEVIPARASSETRRRWTSGAVATTPAKRPSLDSPAPKMSPAMAKYQREQKDREIMAEASMKVKNMLGGVWRVDPLAQKQQQQQQHQHPKQKQVKKVAEPSPREERLKRIRKCEQEADEAIAEVRRLMEQA